MTNCVELYRRWLHHTVAHGLRRLRVHADNAKCITSLQPDALSAPVCLVVTVPETLRCGCVARWQ